MQDHRRGGGRGGLLAVPLTFAPVGGRVRLGGLPPGWPETWSPVHRARPAPRSYSLTADKSTLDLLRACGGCRPAHCSAKRGVMPCAVPGTNGQIRLSGNTMQPRPRDTGAVRQPVGASKWVHFDPPA